MSAAVGFIEK